MSVKGSHVLTSKVPCDVCGKECTKPGLAGHKRFAHGGKATLQAQLSDVKAALQSEIQSTLEAELSEAQSSLTESKAVIEDLQQKLLDSEAKKAELEVRLSATESKEQPTDSQPGAIENSLAEIDEDSWFEIGKKKGFILRFECPQCGGEIYRENGEWIHKIESPQPVKVLKLVNGGIVVKSGESESPAKSSSESVAIKVGVSGIDRETEFAVNNAEPLPDWLEEVYKQS